MIGPKFSLIRSSHAFAEDNSCSRASCISMGLLLFREAGLLVRALILLEVNCVTMSVRAATSDMPETPLARSRHVVFPWTGDPTELTALLQ